MFINFVAFKFRKTKNQVNIELYMFKIISHPENRQKVKNTF